MRRNKILNWNQLQQKSGLSNSAMWELRDGDSNSLSLDELEQIAIALSYPVRKFSR